MSSTGRHYDVASRFELTERQKEVLGLVAAGRTNAEIAEALGITLDGAKFHVREILGKLQVDSREEAAKLWRSRGGRMGRAWRRLTGALPVAVAKLGAGGVGLSVVTVAGLALYAGLAGGGSAHSDVEASSPDGPCSDQLVLSLDTSGGAGGDVVINVRGHNLKEECAVGGIDALVRPANQPNAPDIASASAFVSWAVPPSGDAPLVQFFWENGCGIAGPVDIHVNVGQAEAETTAPVIPSCIDAAKPSTLSPWPAADRVPPPATVPVTSWAPASACDPAQLSVTTAAAREGNNVIFVVRIDGKPLSCRLEGQLSLGVRETGASGATKAIFANPDAIPVHLTLNQTFTGEAFAWENWCPAAGAVNGFYAVVSLSGRSWTSPPIPAPSCTDPSGGSQLRSVQSAALFNDTLPPALTPTPAKTVAPPLTCDANPEPLQISSFERADGAIVINLHAPPPTCQPPDSDGMFIYDLGQPGHPTAAMMYGSFEHKIDVSLTWTNGCGLVGPFDVHASNLGEQGTLVLDDAPACVTPGASHEGTLLP